MKTNAYCILMSLKTGSIYKQSREDIPTQFLNKNGNKIAFMPLKPQKGDILLIAVASDRSMADALDIATNWHREFLEVEPDAFIAAYWNEEHPKIYTASKPHMTQRGYAARQPKNRDLSGWDRKGMDIWSKGF